MPFLIGSRTAQGSAELRSTMIGLRAALDVLLTAAALTLLAGAACAQGNFEIQVYGSETVAPGTTIFELHSNSAIQGTTRREDGVLPTQHAVHETLEITRLDLVVRDWLLHLHECPDVGTRPGATGGWATTSARASASRRNGTCLWGLVFRSRSAISSASSHPTPGRSRSVRSLTRWYFAINPAFEQSLEGPGTKTGIEFTPAAKVSYDLTKTVSLGVEHYGTLGPVGNFPPASRQQQQLYGVVDLNVDLRWEINFGVGGSLTRATDGLIIKMILGRRF